MQVPKIKISTSSDELSQDLSIDSIGSCSPDSVRNLAGNISLENYLAFDIKESALYLAEVRCISVFNINMINVYETIHNDFRSANGKTQSCLYFLRSIEGISAHFLGRLSSGQMVYRAFFNGEHINWYKLGMINPQEEMGFIDHRNVPFPREVAQTFIKKMKALQNNEPLSYLAILNLLRLLELAEEGDSFFYRTQIFQPNTCKINKEDSQRIKRLKHILTTQCTSSENNALTEEDKIFIVSTLPKRYMPILRLFFNSEKELERYRDMKNSSNIAQKTTLSCCSVM